MQGYDSGCIAGKVLLIGLHLHFYLRSFALSAEILSDRLVTTWHHPMVQLTDRFQLLLHNCYNASWTVSSILVLESAGTAQVLRTFNVH
jgi:hypothetical protein